MKTVLWLLAAAVVVAGIFTGCSQDDRDEVAERGSNAWNALK